MTIPNALPVPAEHRGRLARTAGLLYLIVVATGMFSLGYVPSRIVVSGDPAAAMANLQASEPLFRFGIAAAMVCYAAFLLLPLALYRLLAPVGRTAAALMLALAAVGATVSFANLFHKLDILPLLDAGNSIQSLGAERVQAQLALSLSAYGSGLLLCKLFWGLWLLPFGLLVSKSGFLPKLLGYVLVAGGIGYLVDVFVKLVLPGYREAVLVQYATLPAAIGEIGTCLWLLLAAGRPSISRAEQFPPIEPAP